MSKDKILITGANGQLGRVLASELRKLHGNENVLSTDISTTDIMDNKPYEFLDIMNAEYKYWQTEHNLDAVDRLEHYIAEGFPKWLVNHIVTMDTVTASYIARHGGSAL